MRLDIHSSHVIEKALYQRSKSIMYKALCVAGDLINRLVGGGGGGGVTPKKNG